MIMFVVLILNILMLGYELLLRLRNIRLSGLCRGRLLLARSRLCRRRLRSYCLCITVRIQMGLRRLLCFYLICSLSIMSRILLRKFCMSSDKLLMMIGNLSVKLRSLTRLQFELLLLIS